MDKSFYWNDVAIGYLSQLLLALLLSAYLALHTMRRWRLGQLYAPTALLAVGIGACVPGLLSTLVRAMVGAGWDGYAVAWLSPTDIRALAMPWVTVFTDIAILSLVQFAYRFPDSSLHKGREPWVVLALMTGMLLVDGAIAMNTDLDLLRGGNWSRPDWLSYWTGLSIVWLARLFLRQWRLALRKGALPSGPGLRRLIQAHRGNREATASIGFLAFVLLPLGHHLILVFQQHGTLGQFPTDLVIAWSTLIQLPGLTLIYVGYLPEGSSFLFKLTAISILAVLGTITAAAFVVATPYAAAFKPPYSFTAGHGLHLQPVGGGGYAAIPGPSAPPSARFVRIGSGGGALALPFTFSFFGRPYHTAYVAADGSIGFEHTPAPADIHVAYGAQPAVYPLIAPLPPQGAMVMVSLTPDRLVIVRRDVCAPAPDCHAFQTVLHRDGRIDMDYSLPLAQAAPDPNRPLDSQDLSVVTPGWQAAQGNMTPGNRGKAPSIPAKAVIRDNRRAFLAFLDQLYAPFVSFTVAVTLILAVGLPLLYRWILVNPLARLLKGIRQFEKGVLDTQVPVTFHDEIGYLTASFNTMAQTQSELVNGLEATIAERVEAVVDMTARNAQLEERTRLSADLHDSVSQTLFSASMLSSDLLKKQSLEPDQDTGLLKGLDRLNREALLEMRLLIAELRSGAEGVSSLGDRLAAQARTFEDRHGVPVSIEILADTPLPMEVFAMIHRIHGECLANIARHARATHVEVVFESLPGQALLVTRDNGRGFDPTKIKGDHLGLQIMRERAQQIAATLEIETSPGGGTAVTLIWMADHSA